MLQALELIKQYKSETTHATQYYAHGEHVPIDGVIPADLIDLLHERGRGRRTPAARNTGGELDVLVWDQEPE